MPVAAESRYAALAEFMGKNYNRELLGILPKYRDASRALMDNDLHSPPRQLIELRMEHGDLDNLIDVAAAAGSPADDLTLRRLKKRRLALRDRIAQLEAQIEPPEPA